MPSIDTKVFLNPTQTIGEVLPTIYIEKIKLESNTGSPIKQRNPHIDWNRSLRTPMGRIQYSESTRLAYNRGNEDTDVEAQNVQQFLAAQTAEPLKVTVNLVAKDRVINQKTSWFSNFGIDLKDYIYVHVVQTTTEVATQTWSNYDGTAFGPGVWTQAWSGTSYRKLPLRDFGGSNDLVTANGSTTNPNLRTKYVEADSQGNRILNMTHIIDGDGGNAVGTFQKPVLNDGTQHLAYFVYTNFDLTKLAEDFGMQRATIQTMINNGTFPGAVMSKMTSDIVIRRGKTVSNAYVFVTRPNSNIPGGQLWTGPVHYHDENNPAIIGEREGTYFGYMGGSVHNPNQPQQQLIKKKVKNNTIQDLRIAKKIEKLNLNFSILENELLSKTVKDPKVDTSIIKRAASYFTDINLSRDVDGNCRFFFGIDLKKLVRENSIFNSLFRQGSPAARAIMEKTRIVSMKIYRVRLEGSSAQGGDILSPRESNQFLVRTNPRKFNTWGEGNNPPMVGNDLPSRPGSDVTIKITNQSDELILSVGKRDGDPELHGTSHDGLAQLQQISGLFMAADMDDADLEIKYFTGVDKRMAFITDGYYTYRIELEIHDGSYDYLKNKLQTLINEKERLLEYYKTGTQIGITGIPQPRQDDSAVTIQQNMNANNLGKASYFNPIANRFTMEFIKWCATRYPDANDAPWNTAANLYLRTLSIFTSLGSEQSNEILDALKNYLNPISGNPEGINKVIDLMSQLESKLKEAIAVVGNENYIRKRQDSGTAPQTADPGPGASRVAKLIRINHEFRDIFNSNVPKGLGFDFMGESISLVKYAGLRKIESNIFDGIVRRETLKLYSNENAIINIVDPSIHWDLQETDFTYFTPSKIYNYSSLETPIRMDQWTNSTDELVGSAVSALFLNSENPEYGSAQHRSRTAVNPFERGANEWEEAGRTGGQGFSDENILVRDDGRAGVTADFLAQNQNLIAVAQNLGESINPNSLPGDEDVDESDEDIIFGPNGYTARSREQYKQNRQAFPLFQELSIDFVGYQPIKGSQQLPSSPPHRKSLNFYNPNATSGFMSALADPMVEGAAVLGALPNQIKALIKWTADEGKTSNNPVRVFNPHAQQLLLSDVFNEPSKKTRARYLFETINKLEVLTGFGDVENPYGDELSREPSVQIPRWEPLTRNVYQRARGNLLLCRLRPYQNLDFKIQTTPNLDLPIIEEYFFLQGDESYGTGRDKPATEDPTVAPEAPLTLTDNQPAYQYTNDPATQAGGQFQTQAQVQGAAQTDTTTDVGSIY